MVEQDPDRSSVHQDLERPPSGDYRCVSAKEERPNGERDEGSRRPAVVCTTCGFAWHSAAMAYGLRLLGSCPRCDGRLDFGSAAARDPEDAGRAEGEPHLVLGRPRPPRRD